MGKVGSTIRDNIGIILLVVAFVAFMAYIQVQKTSPGNVVIGAVTTFIESTAVPIATWLSTFHIYLPALVCVGLGGFLVWGLPRMWGKRSAVTSSVQKTAAKVKPSMPIAKLDNPGTEVKETIASTASEIKSTSEQAKAELEKIKSSA